MSAVSDTAPPTPTPGSASSSLRHSLWVVEESFGEESLHVRLERGLLSWQQVIRVSTDLCKALAFLQDMRRTVGSGGVSSMMEAEAAASVDSLMDDVDDDDLLAGQQQQAGLADAVLSAYALRTVVTPSNVYVDPQSTKASG
jgi:hypothetical protein